MFALFSSVRKVLAPVWLGCAAFGLAGCDPSLLPVPGGSNPGPAVDNSAPVQVALLVPGGSGNAGTDQIARSLENAARLAIADLQGAKIDLRVYNTAGNASQAANMAATAVNDGAKIILGPLFAEAANAAGLAVAGTGVNILSFSNNVDIAGGNVYVLGNTFRNTASRLVTYARARGKSKIVVVHARNIAGEAGRDAVLRALADRGLTPAGVNPYEFSQPGVVSAVSEVAATAQGTGADAIFFTSDTAGALPIFVDLLPERGIATPATQFVGLTRWDIPAQNLALPGVQGGWFALPDPVKMTAFQNRYNTTFGTSPHPLATLSYDGIAAVGALIARGGDTPLGGSAITQNSGFQGTSGIFRLRQDGTSQRGMAVATIVDNKVVVIDPAPQSFGVAGF